MRRRIEALLVAAALAGCGGATPAPKTPAADASASAPRPIRVDDFYELGYLSGLEVSPDGASAIYTWTQPDKGKDAFRTRLFRLEIGSGAASGEPITGEAVDASDAKFSPDGRFLAWLESTDSATATRRATSASRTSTC